MLDQCLASVGYDVLIGELSRVALRKEFEELDLLAIRIAETLNISKNIIHAKKRGKQKKQATILFINIAVDILNLSYGDIAKYMNKSTGYVGKVRADFRALGKSEIGEIEERFRKIVNVYYK